MAYFRLPLILKILVGAAVGVALGYGLGPRADALRVVSDVVLQLLTLLATPLIFLGLFHALLTAEVKGRLAARLGWVLLTNSFAAALIGLVVVQVVAPGRHIQSLTQRQYPSSGIPPSADPLTSLVSRIPHDIVSPFAGNDMLGIVILASAFALALRFVGSSQDLKAEGLGEGRRIANIAAYAKLGLDTVIRMLHWVFELIPLAVLAVVARMVGTAGLAPFGQMAWFVAAVLVALLLTGGFYAARLRLSSRFGPVQFVRGASDALALAFSTASSAATLPITYECAVHQLGVSEEAASLGVMAAGPVNHDGGALYQVVSALCVAQMIGRPLGFTEVVVLVFIAVLASICTAGIPQAGLVSMVAVFSAVHLPAEWIPFLLPVDWFLDRCRTTINVAGNLVATCVVDGEGIRPRA